jgi:outer membrane protein with beta-barrel domain
MKKILIVLLVSLPFSVFSQFGLKAGINFANVTNASSINSSHQSGFHGGVFLAPPSKSIISSRTELIYSKQGYDYASGNNTGSVNLDYIVLPQYMAINITKYLQIQLGGQMAYLLSAKVDSSNGMSTGNAQADQIMSYYNRFDYGFGGGIEVHPVAGLLIGARVSIGLNSLYKNMENPSSGTPSFIPKVDVKNNLFQISAGWIFGKKSTKKK